MFITIENRTMHNKVQYDNMQEKGIWQNVGFPFSYVKKMLLTNIIVLVYSNLADG